MKKLKILIVEDDDLARIGLSSVLGNFGNVDEVGTAKEAEEKLNNTSYDIAFFDLDLEFELAGLELITLAVKKNIYPVVLSGRKNDEVILQAYRNGCEDFLAKPYRKDIIEKIIRAYTVYFSKGKGPIFSRFITQDENLKKQLDIIKDVIKSDQPIIILGPTGTGKSFLAKEIHNLIFSNDKFISLNCAELPENLLESELFGHVEGAFSGAISKKTGKLSLADGGTLFLDEIATMSLRVQQKLLKAIEEQTFYPLGSTKKIKSKFRLMSATCENLEGMVDDGSFRKDLYFRIDGFKIELKPLSDRVKDIPLLMKYFNDASVRRVVYDKEAVELLCNYSWPGNIRELKKINKILQLKSDGVVTCHDLPTTIRNDHKISLDSELISKEQLEYIESEGMKAFIRKIEKEVVTYYLKKNGNKVRSTMLDLKLSNNAFYRIMKDI